MEENNTPSNLELKGDPSVTLTIRLIMQGKVSLFIVFFFLPFVYGFYFCFHPLYSSRIHFALSSIQPSLLFLVSYPFRIRGSFSFFMRLKAICVSWKVFFSTIILTKFPYRAEIFVFENKHVSIETNHWKVIGVNDAPVQNPKAAINQRDNLWHWNDGATLLCHLSSRIEWEWTLLWLTVSMWLYVVWINSMDLMIKYEIWMVASLEKFAIQSTPL